MIEKLELLVEKAKVRTKEKSQTGVALFAEKFYETPASRRDTELKSTGYCVECHACNSGCYMCQF